jgi:hypothetical protein
MQEEILGSTYELNLEIAFANDSWANKNNRKPTMPKQKSSRPKRNIPDKDIIKMLMIDDTHPSDSEEEQSESEDIDCSNPLCDHKENTKMKPVFFAEIKDIHDLIALGKTYHCKTNKIYNGVNLRILCDLVPALTDLSNLVGMSNVKQNIINQIVFFLQGFNEKSKCGKCLDCVYNLPCIQSGNKDMLHTVITGPPGVGKTELGKILGKIYKALGILSKGHMFIATRTDLIGKYLGHTAAKTQAFIDKCKGGVMFIDEAYSLGNPEGRDSFSKECIDVLNQNLSERRDFLCIIAGYKEQLDKCFFAYNPGLARRFTFRYDITGYTPSELMDIFNLKVQQEGWHTEYDKNRALDFFTKNKALFPHYGGDIETLFLNCKIIHGKRVLFKDPSVRKIITLNDIEKGFELFVNHRKQKTTPKLSFYS